MITKNCTVAIIVLLSINSLFAQTKKVPKKKSTAKPTTNARVTSNTSVITNVVGAVSSVLSQDDISNGLKQALTIGAKNASTQLNQTDGYYLNPLVKIPFPAEISFVSDKIRELGLGALVDDFEKSLNRAAESAAIEAAPIFANAITSITFNDAKNILLGGNGAATNYLRQSTYSPLQNAFSPIIQKNLSNLGVTDKWTYIINYYNEIPFITNVNPDLAAYTTGKALDGLFVVVAQEENKIRQDAKFQVTDLLKQVFGQSTTTK